ncbi:MAG: TonB family protein [Magnetococcus sp. YQC-9]
MNAIQVMPDASKPPTVVLPPARHQPFWLALILSLLVHALLLLQFDLRAPREQKPLPQSLLAVELVAAPQPKPTAPQEPITPPATTEPPVPQALEPPPPPPPAPKPLPETPPPVPIIKAPDKPDGIKPARKPKEKPKSPEKPSRKIEEMAPRSSAKEQGDPLTRPLNLNPSLSELTRWDRERSRQAREYGIKAQEETINLDTPKPQYTAYFTRLKERIQQGWIYPAEAKRNQLSGSLAMRFTIERDGAISDIRIERPSGAAILDQAALQAVRNIHPFLPLPDDWNLERIHIKTVFEYIRGGFRMEP